MTYTLPVGTLLTCEGGHVVGEVIEELTTGRIGYAACLGKLADKSCAGSWIACASVLVRRAVVCADVGRYYTCPTQPQSSKFRGVAS